MKRDAKAALVFAWGIRMVSDSQSFSLPRNVQLPRVTFRKTTEIHAANVWELIAKWPQLDRNSLYCDLLLCSDFADTRVVAERAGAVVGWLSAYRRRAAHPRA
ncbi:hypothetical protein [Mesorhizobium sp.]|uniref:hypothetical protein n=1 Tax=Mesorhizobium sp. TaxID=1871066 RepID=UPI0025BE412B|nr:hypothetical protein [Mesorhizobium sp.]